MFDIKKLKSWDTVLILVLSSAFIYLFIENFVLASSFDIIQLRGIDDLAFNQSINYWHHELCRFSLSRLINMNHYGYGCIFWFIHGLITFPFYLLHNETLTIATARNISLLFSFGTLFFLHRILGYYTKSSFYKMLIVLLVASTSAFPFFAMRFDTATIIMFFAVLGVYFLLRDEELARRSIIYSALSVAAAVGTKLTGVFILPLVVLLLLDRLHFDLSKESLKKIWLYVWVFVLSTIFFTNPGLLLFFIFRDEVRQYFDIMSYYLNNSSTNAGGPENLNIPFLFLSVMKTNVYCVYGFLVFIFLYVMKIFQDFKEKKYHFLYYLITILFTLTALLFTVKQGATYIGKYFTIASIFIPFSLLALERFRKIGYIFAILIFSSLFYISNVAVRHSYFGQNIRTNYALFWAYNNSEKIRDLSTVQRDLKTIIPYNPTSGLTVLCDYRTIPPYSVFRENMRLTILFDNLSTSSAIKNVDYIILEKKAPSFLSENEINKLGAREAILADKNIITKLMTDNIYQGHKYKLIYDKFGTIAYERVD